MVELVSIPFLKTYIFPTWSFTFLTRLFLIVLTIVAPFFIVYQTGSTLAYVIITDFYQSSKTSYIPSGQFSLKPTY